MILDRIQGREILDSRGFPTVEADVWVSGHLGRAAVPSGASTGQFEAVELRDGDKKRFQGKGVLKAVSNIHNVIAPALVGKSITEQAELDKILCELDGTENKSRLGANALLAVSLAFARARAAAFGKPAWRIEGMLPQLPVPMMNIINGGVHADNPLSIQEFMIVPYGFDLFSDALRAGVEIFHTLKSILKKKNLSVNVGDEGGFAPYLKSSRETLDLVVEAIQKAGYQPGHQVGLALDVAASEIYENGLYALPEEQLTLSAEQLIVFYDQLVHNYPIISIEDGMGETDQEGWCLLTQEMGAQIQLIGDDLFVTNPSRFAAGIKSQLANGILVKVNQIGTLTEALQTVVMAREAGYQTVISHRSGETEDVFIADLAVGSGAGQIKTGSLARSDRVSKYNQLLRIQEFNPGISFAGVRAFKDSVIQRVRS